VVVSDKGQMYTFGWSKYGQLGHGDNGWVASAPAFLNSTQANGGAGRPQHG